MKKESAKSVRATKTTDSHISRSFMCGVTYRNDAGPWKFIQPKEAKAKELNREAVLVEEID